MEPTMGEPLCKWCYGHGDHGGCASCGLTPAPPADPAAAPDAELDALVARCCSGDARPREREAGAAIDSLRAELAAVERERDEARGYMSKHIDEREEQRKRADAAEAKLSDLRAHVQAACPLGWAAGAYMDEARAWELRAVELLGGEPEGGGSDAG